MAGNRWRGPDRGSTFQFAKHGQCGMDVSELLPHTAKCVDNIAFVRSVQADNGNHPAAVFQMNAGFVVPGNPSIGAWLTFGHGPAVEGRADS